MMMSGKAKTYQVIHEVVPHEGDQPGQDGRFDE